MNDTIYETATMIATAKIVTLYNGKRAVEVDLMPRLCSSLYTARVHSDGSEDILVRVKSQRTHLPAVVKAAALKLLGA